MPISTLPSIYCNSLTEYSRLNTREVKVGDLGIGSNNPIRVQSMTTTDTMDTIKTVEQSIRMIDAGCELVRITAPSIKEAKNLENIKNELRKRGYNIPICADIHFTPNAAEHAAKIVEKVRINPGNYADRKKFEHIEYTDKSYDEELERIRERFLPLIKICKENGTAMRIGTNHGSLSDRILSRYGDTPLGMVESAFEFLRICEEENYFDIVLSMKASNTQVMVQAYRLLVRKMMERDAAPSLKAEKDILLPLGSGQIGLQIYPLHLGVTEAGDGEDGRIKSAVGIGALLEDGLGDTIRVSLTEDPEFEIPVAKNLVERYNKRNKHKPIPDLESNIRDSGFSPFEYKRRETTTVNNIGGHNVPRIIADFASFTPKIVPAQLFSVGYNYSIPLDKWNLTDQACDYVYLGDNEIDFEIPGTLGLIYNSEKWSALKNKTRSYPLFCGSEYFRARDFSPALRMTSDELNFVAVDIDTLMPPEFRIQDLDKTVVLVFETSNDHGMAEQRSMFFELMQPHSNSPLQGESLKIPVIIKRSYADLSEEKFQLYSSIDFGGLLLDGFGDGIWISVATDPKSLKGLSNSTSGIGGNRGVINPTAFGILQATRTRISKTEYISCPSCGRTLFDLQETTGKIRARTSHLKGIKIGIMGCIVNGPGEMADADYGYVGTGIGKITLYKGKQVVKRSIPAETAVDELISLIKKNGDWVETA
jgi:(E)-4-hydroxy-3-methylbut-2-enyl-diphosphate synthase